MHCNIAYNTMHTQRIAKMDNGTANCCIFFIVYMTTVSAVICLIVTPRIALCINIFIYYLLWQINK